MSTLAGDVIRRGFLKAGVALGGPVVAGEMPLSQAIWAAEGKVLVACSDRDLTKLDPALYNRQLEVDLMSSIIEAHALQVGLRIGH